LYLKEISKIPLLTVEEERELGRRAQAGDVIAVQKLVESNLRFVIKVARKLVRRPGQLMELVNVGNMGLIEAARRFDPEKNVRFTSYEIWWIRQAIFHHLAGTTHAFRVSPKVENILYLVTRILNQTVQGIERMDRKELAAKVGVSTKELNAALEAVGGTASLDEPIGEEGELRLSDLIEQTRNLSPEQLTFIKNRRHSLEKAIEKLAPVEQLVIRLRFGLNEEPPMTLKEIGGRIHRSRERVRQIERDALKKLKGQYSGQALSSYLN
jgi:RNA polymerase primary sigma factor